MNLRKSALILVLVGITVGAVVGWLYYYYVGCNTGTCAITSKPLNSTLYGALMGGLFFNLIGDFYKPNLEKPPK
jgi:hypothetical protein